MVRWNETASRAFLLVILFWAAANVLSYFVRSDGWGDLLGQAPQTTEAIGFPWLIWQEGGTLGNYSRLALVGNVVIALLSALAAAEIAAWLARRRDQDVAVGDLHRDREASQHSAGRALQFRIRTLLALVVVEAIILGGIRSYGDARPALLAAIYLLGPSVLLAVGWRLRDVVPTHRNVALVVVGFLFVPAAAFLGESIEGIGDFTRGLLGLFVCWVPQCVLLVVLFTTFSRAKKSPGII